MRLSSLLFGGIAAGSAAAQFVVAHDVGIVVRADIDHDALDDLFVIDSHAANAYFGRAASPYLMAGPSTVMPEPHGIAPPVVAGGYLYVAFKPTIDPSAYVEVFAIGRDGRLTSCKTYRLDPAQPTAKVATLRLAPLGWDFDLDGGEDVLVAWSDLPMTQNSFAATYLAPGKCGDRAVLPPAPGQSDNAVVVGLHRASSMTQPDDDFLMVVSGPQQQKMSGFGFRVLHRGVEAPVCGKTLWMSSAPSLALGGWLQHTSASTYGNFQPTPVLSVPLLKFCPGPSILFHPELGTPFVSPLGTFLGTSQDGFFIDAATADYDGDGSEEVVFVEARRDCITDWLFIADPGENRAYIQAFVYGPRGGSPCTAHVFTPFHGAAADINGDDATDLVLSCSIYPDNGSTFSVLLGSHDPGRPPLTRAY